MIGHKIRDYVKKNNVDLESITAKTKIPKTHLFEMFDGDRPIFALEYIKICKALNIDTQTFL